MRRIKTTAGSAFAPSGHPATALLLIDFQADFLKPDGRLPAAPGQVAPMIAATLRVITQAQRASRPIIRIGNEFHRRDLLRNLLRRNAALAGSTGAAWDARVHPANTPYVAKWRPDAFCNPRLAELLQHHGVTAVTLCGLYAEACISATAATALRCGLEVSVVAEAVGSRSDSARRKALERLRAQGIRICAGPDAIE